MAETGRHQTNQSDKFQTQGATKTSDVSVWLPHACGHVCLGVCAGTCAHIPSHRGTWEKMDLEQVYRGALVHTDSPRVGSRVAFWVPVREFQFTAPSLYQIQVPQVPRGTSGACFSSSRFSFALSYITNVFLLFTES